MMHITLILIVTTALSIMGYAGKLSFWCDLTSHFQVQYLMVFFWCAAVCCVRKQWKTALLSLGLSSLNLTVIIPLYISPIQASAAGTSARLKLLLINVNSQNNRYTETAEYIRTINPDVLAIEEINESWVEGLRSVLKEYPYFKEELRHDNFGIGLYSRVPLEKMSLEYWGEAEIPSIRSTVRLDNRPVTLVFTHPVPPVSRTYFKWRNDQLRTIASKRRDFANDLILIGDLNTSSWSYYFKKFTKDLGVRDSRLGFGLQTSWPTFMPLLRTTIDHCLVSNAVVVYDRKVGPHIGSDHYPLYIEVGF